MISSLAKLKERQQYTTDTLPTPHHPLYMTCCFLDMHLTYDQMIWPSYTNPRDGVPSVLSQNSKCKYFRFVAMFQLTNTNQCAYVV